MTYLPKISKDEFLESIREGVTDAILTMTESGNGYSGPIRKDEFMESIREGVQAAIWSIATNATSMPCADFYDCIQKGVKEAMDFKTFEGEV